MYDLNDNVDNHKYANQTLLVIILKQSSTYMIKLPYWLTKNCFFS